MSLLTRRRALLSAKGGLPSAYQRVEYLESNGSNYIDTDIIVTTNTKVVLDMQILRYKPNANQYNFILGTRNSYGGASRFELLLHYDSRLWFNFGTDFTNRVIQTIYQDYKRNINTLDSATTRLTMDNTLLSDCGGVNSVAFEYIEKPLRIFCENFSDSLGSVIKFYDMKVHQDNILIANFIPCYRKADNEAGLYDLVNGKFYTSKGTGEFILGGEV